MKTLSLTLAVGILTSGAAVSVIAASIPDSVWKTNVFFTYASSVRFSPDSTLVAVGSYSGPAKLWTVSNAIVLRSFTISQDNVVAVAFSPDGTRLVGGGGNGFIRMWQVNNGAILYSGGVNNDGFGSIAYSPNGALFALARERPGINLRDGTNGSGVLLFGDDAVGGVTSIEFSPDSQLLAAARSSNAAELWRVSDGAMLQNFNAPASPVAFTPDGKYVAYGNYDGTASFWDLQTNGVARVFPGWGSAVRLTSDGKLLLTLNGNLLNFWRVADGTLLVSYDTAPDGGALSLDISPDRKFYAYGTYDGTVVLARMPLVIEEVLRSGNQTILKWQGGSGLYQLQIRRDFTSDSWHDEGSPTTNTIATNVSSGMHFFRVQSLPNP